MMNYNVVELDCLAILDG